jgi:hypothetical protein
MDPQLRARAEARLAEAARAEGIADPRPPYRDRLRQLRESEPDTFDRAIQHYEQHVLPALAERPPLPVWLEYGRFLAALSAPGHAVRIDTLGRATPWTPDSAVALVLFIPDSTAAEVMILCQPEALSDAQQATIAVLVRG